MKRDELLPLCVGLADMLYDNQLATRQAQRNIQRSLAVIATAKEGQEVQLHRGWLASARADMAAKVEAHAPLAARYEEAMRAWLAAVEAEVVEPKGETDGR